MAYDFPSSPTNGQTYTAGNKNYTYNGSAWELTQVVLNSDNIAEGTSNLYLNEPRFRDLANTVGLANVNNTTFTGNILFFNNTNFLSETLFSNNTVFSDNVITVGNVISEGISTFDSNANFYGNTTFNSNVTNTGNASMFGELNLYSNTIVPGLITLTQTADKVGTFLNLPSGTQTVDFRSGLVVINNPTGNVLLSIQNVPTADNNIYNLGVVMFTDGLAGNLHSNVLINGVDYNVRWLDDSLPYSSLASIIGYSFAIIRTKQTFYVIGQQSDYFTI